MTGKAVNVEDFRARLLGWYDRHRRILPWRALPGQVADPYHVWLSEIMLQQTTVQAVIPYFLKFLEKWPNVHDLAAARAEDVMENWAGLGYYARARNLHKCAKAVSEELNGIFPQDQNALQALPGIGDYTSAAITAIAFNHPANVVDGNVERVMARIFAVREPVPGAKPELKRLAGNMAAGEVTRPGDYAQSLMDLGATICTPKSPKCMICPVALHCKAREKGIAEALPARAVKAKKPQRHGYVYWITDKKRRVLLERRPEKGLLAGTVGLPTSDWIDTAMEKTHLDFIIKGQETAVRVRHVFTHFDLDLRGYTASLKDGNIPDGRGYFWVSQEEARNTGIPTVFGKALKQFI